MRDFEINEGKTLLEIIKEGLIKHALKLGSFEFANLSGKSPMKMEIDKLVNYEEYANYIRMGLHFLLGYGVECVGGVATGGMPWAQNLAESLKVPYFWIKKDSIEGMEIRDLRRCIGLIEDVITTGGSLDRSVSLLEDRAEVTPKTVAIFNYGFRKDVRALVYFEDIADGLPKNKKKEILIWYERMKGEF